MFNCPHCLQPLEHKPQPGEPCPQCGAVLEIDEELAGKQTFELIPGGGLTGDESENVLDDVDIANEDEGTLPFGGTIEINKPVPTTNEDDKNTIELAGSHQTMGDARIDEIVIDDSDEDSGESDDLHDDHEVGDEGPTSTIVFSGGVTQELSEPIATGDDQQDEDDDHGTVDHVGDVTIDLGSAEAPAAPIANSSTVDFDSDFTIELTGDPELAKKVSSTWMHTVDLQASAGQTIQQGDQSKATQKSSLPVKSRKMTQPEDQNKGTVTYLNPSDAPDYELLSQIGEGGMGVVYAARQSSIARKVAVKMLKPSAKAGAEQRDKFISEAVVTGELDHPNIVPIYDLGANDQGALFYSMKHVQGTPWEDVLKQKSLEENLNILLRVADAVAFAHARGVVHRDLKPENVMLGEFGEVLVMDWGLARVTQEFPNSDSIHQSDSLGGTPAYMAPEMARGPVEVIDHTSDIYLLGAMLYEIIGGRPPHSGRQVMQCLMAAAENTIDPIEYEGELKEVALEAMSTDQARRFQTVKDFQVGIRQYLSHSESLVLSSHAERHLNQARESHDYQLYARAMYGFQESLALWDENTKARKLLADTELAYADQALTNDDLDLAESLLDTDKPEHEELLTRVHDAQRERISRQAMLKWTKRAVAALLVAFVALGAYSYINIANKNVVIAQERDYAKEQEDIAKEQRDIADQKRIEANEQREEADNQRKKAEDSQREAEKNAKAARKAESEARKAENEARLAETEAREAEQIAKDAKLKEEYEAYVASIGLAAAKIDENAYDFASQLLAVAPVERRHWEWGRLSYLTRLSEAVYDNPAEVDAVAYSNNGQLIASGDRTGTITIRQAESGDVVHQIKAGAYVYSVAFSPKDNLLAAGTSDGSIKIIDIATGDINKTLNQHTDGVLDVSFSADGQQLASAGYDNTALVWDLPRGEVTAKLAGHNWWVWSARFSPDAKRIVTASQDSNVIVWQLGDNDVFKPTAYYTDHKGPVYSADFSPSGERIATAGYDKTIRIWNPEEAGERNLSNLLTEGETEDSNALVLTGHTGAVRSVTFDSTGAVLLSGAHDNTLRLWNTTSGEELKTLRGHGSRVESVALAPAGDRAASAGQDKTIRVWDIAGYAESQVLGSRQLNGHSDAVLAARFTGGGQVLTASRDRTAKLWDSTGAELAKYAQGHEFLATSAQFVDAGQRLVTGAGDNTARLWEVGTGAELMVFGSTGSSGTIAADAEGRYLVTGGKGSTAQLWNLSTGKRIALLTGHNSEVTAAAFDGNAEQFATGDNQGDILVWRFTENGTEQVAKLTGHSRAITSLRFTPMREAVYSSSGDNTCAKWDIATAKEIPSGLLKHPDWVAAMDLSIDGQRMVTACEDGRVRWWNLETGKVQAEATLGGSTATGVDLSADDQSVLITSADLLSVWQWKPSENTSLDLSKQQPVFKTETDGTLWSARFAPNGQRMLTIGGNDARMVDLATGQRGVRFSPHGAVAAVAMSPDGKLVATGSWDGTAKLWNRETQKVVGQLVGGHDGYINSLDFAPDGKTIATASDDGTVRLWNVATGETLGESIMAHKGSVNSVRFSADAKQLLTTGSDRTAKLWDIAKGELVRTFKGHKSSVLCGEFSSDAAHIVTGSRDNTARVWLAATGESKATLSGHTSAVTSVAFTPDAARVLTGSQDTTAKLWDADKGGEILTLTGHKQDLSAVDFTEDGQTALTASRDGTAILWPAVEWKD